jgi:GntR family transcriptional repressor for pyruvate dehydrogenase complex
MTALPAAGPLPDAVLRPASGNAFELTVGQLATAIRLGVFTHGAALPPERELAERLGVSRNTLREAIAALRDAGLVATRRGRGGGTRVTYAGVEPGDGSRGLPERLDVDDALDYRSVVEPGAAELAAMRTLSAADRRWLRQSVTETRAAPDTATHRMADSRLHLAIATVTGSALVVEAVTRAQAALHEMLTAIPVLRPNIDNSNDQHDQIVTAILAGDGGAARTAMAEHCAATAALLRGLLG